MENLPYMLLRYLRRDQLPTNKLSVTSQNQKLRHKPIKPLCDSATLGENILNPSKAILLHLSLITGIKASCSGVRQVIIVLLSLL